MQNTQVHASFKLLQYNLYIIYILGIQPQPLLSVRPEAAGHLRFSSFNVKLY